MKSITININGKDWLVKQSFRTYLLYEEISGKQIGDITTMNDILTLLFCTFKGCNKDWTYNFDEFIDIIDEDPTIFSKFNDFNTSIVEPEKKRKVKE